jgi:hypothetical protein
MTLLIVAIVAFLLGCEVDARIIERQGPCKR